MSSEMRPFTEFDMAPTTLHGALVCFVYCVEVVCQLFETISNAPCSG